MMYHFCRAANVPPILSGGVPADLDCLKHEFQRAFRSDYRGTRLNDILGLGTSSRIQVEVQHEHVHLSNEMDTLLATHLGLNSSRYILLVRYTFIYDPQMLCRVRDYAWMELYTNLHLDQQEMQISSSTIPLDLAFMTTFKH